MTWQKFYDAFERGAILYHRYTNPNYIIFVQEVEVYNDEYVVGTNDGEYITDNPSGYPAPTPKE